MSSFFTGQPGRFEKTSRLRPSQEGLYDQLQAANRGRGAGGSFGEAGDYYRDLLSNDSQTANEMFAPEQRRFNEQIIPGLSEQFAGMGAGGLSSSGFRNAAVNAGTDLSERLGAIRAQLKQQGAAGLMGLGQQGLEQFDENIYRPQSKGFLDFLGPIAGGAVGAFGGPFLGAAGSALANKFSSSLNNNAQSQQAKQTGGFSNFFKRQ